MKMKFYLLFTSCDQITGHHILEDTIYYSFRKNYTLLSQEQYTRTVCAKKENIAWSQDFDANVISQLPPNYVLHLQSDIASAVSFTCQTSTVFMKAFIRYTRHHGLCKNLAKKKCERIIICIIMSNPNKYWIDHTWNKAVQILVEKRMMLEDAMAWLNTLGGGYSALGDYFIHHAKAAADISLQQLKIALELGDPGTVIRCKLYYAQSLMQQGHLRRAKYAIRYLYKEVIISCPRDRQLKAMCHGLWSRLRYFYSTRHTERKLVKANNTNGVNVVS